MSDCKKRTKFIPAACAWTLFLVLTGLYFAFPCRHAISEQYEMVYIVVIVQGILTMFVTCNFFLATFMDPGVIPRAGRDEQETGDDFRAPLYRTIQINGITVRMKWCVTCQFYRPPRCSHCSVCNGCIESFDHHCPWVNNCIGRRNYRYFFSFLIFLSLHMIWMFTFAILFILRNKEHLHEKNVIVTLVVVVFIILLFFPILGLTGFHVVLVFRARTTNEQVTGKFRGGYNPFSRGCFSNALSALCGPQYPRYKVTKKPGRTLSVAAPSVSARMIENKVRIYMDKSNSAVPGRTDASDVDVIMDSFEATQSQSQDCEPSPPIPRHGSKTNFFNPGVQDSSPGRLSHVLQQGKPWSPYGSAGPPTPRAPRAPTGMEDRGIQSNLPRSPEGSQPNWPNVNSPRMMAKNPPRSVTSPGMGSECGKNGIIMAQYSPSRKSNPGSPTSNTITGQSPSVSKRHIGTNVSIGPQLRHGVHPLYYVYQVGTRGAHANARSMSPNRKFASESELVHAAADKANGNYEARVLANQTADNIQELANCTTLVQGHFADGSGASAAQSRTRYSFRGNHGSNPNTPTSQSVVYQPFAVHKLPPSVHPGPHGRRHSGSASPQSKRYAGQTATVSAEPQQPQIAEQSHSKRPVSFVKALELTDSYDKQAKNNIGTPKTDHRSRQCSQAKQALMPEQEGSDRKSLYEMNYEISV